MEGLLLLLFLAAPGLIAVIWDQLNERRARREGMMHFASEMSRNETFQEYLKRTEWEREEEGRKRTQKIADDMMRDYEEYKRGNK